MTWLHGFRKGKYGPGYCVARVHPSGRALLLIGEGLDPAARGLGFIGAAWEGDTTSGPRIGRKLGHIYPTLTETIASRSSPVRRSTTGNFGGA